MNTRYHPLYQAGLFVAFFALFLAAPQQGMAQNKQVDADCTDGVLATFDSGHQGCVPNATVQAIATQQGGALSTMAPGSLTTLFAADNALIKA